MKNDLKFGVVGKRLEVNKSRLRVDKTLATRLDQNVTVPASLIGKKQKQSKQSKCRIVEGIPNSDGELYPLCEYHTACIYTDSVRTTPWANYTELVSLATQ